MIISRSLEDDLRSVHPSAVALGLFDGLHLGHRRVIGRAAAQEGLRPCVFTFSTRAGSPPPDAKKNAGRLTTYRLREQLLEQMGVACMLRPDFSAIRQLTPREFVDQVLRQTLGARFVCCGANFRFGRAAAGDAHTLAELCAEHGIRVETVPLLEIDGEPVSSSRIRACIAQGEIPGANRLLGRPFTIDFEVVHGRQLGRTLDAPTINQPFPRDFVVPRYGVYATLSWVNGKRYPSITNVGVKPTVGSAAVLAETYIHSFSGDLYGSRIAVEFLEFMRPERKFDSIPQLRAQIQSDAKQAGEIGLRYIGDTPQPKALDDSNGNK